MNLKTILSRPSPPPTSPTLHLWLLLPFLLLLFWQGASRLDLYVLNIDEFYSINHVGTPSTHFTLIQTIESVIQYSPTHAPGYFLLLNMWMSLVGSSIEGARLFTLLFGLLLVAWTYRLGRAVAAAQVGFYGALLVSINVYILGYAYAARMYTLLPLLALVVLWLYWRINLSRRPTRGYHWGLLYLCSAGLLYVHYLGIIPLIVLGLLHGWRLLRAGWSAAWWGTGVTMVLVGLSFAPWVQVLLRGMDKRADMSDSALSGAEIFIHSAWLASNGGIVVLLLLLLVSLAAAIVHRRRQSSEWLLWFFCLVTLLVALALNTQFGYLTLRRFRYVIFVLPLLALAMGIGLAQLNRWRWLPPIAIAVLIVSGVRFVESERFRLSDASDPVLDFTPPLHQMVEVMQPQLEGSDYLIGTLWPFGLIFNRRHQTALTDYYLEALSIEYDLLGPYIQDADFADQLRAILDEATATYDTIWLMYQPYRTPHVLPLLHAALDDSHVLCAVPMDVSLLRLERYEPAGACTPLPFAFSPSLTYLDGEAQINMVAFDRGGIDSVRLERDGQIIATTAERAIATSWTIADSISPDTYSASLQLFSSAGEKVWQSDYGIEPAFYDIRRTPLPDDLPPGEYEVRVVVYNWRTGEIATGQNNGTGEQGDLLTAFSFSVADAEH